jgi:hypothetical protein
LTLIFLWLKLFPALPPKKSLAEFAFEDTPLVSDVAVKGNLNQPSSTPRHDPVPWGFSYMQLRLSSFRLNDP